MLDVESLKRKILEFLQEHGPSLPIKVAKSIEQELVFTSALLGELLSNKRVYASNMRVGSSQVYYLKGQEQQLETFADEHLNGFVKQAYLTVKEHGFVIDAEQEPALRVALRSIKDFASPFTYQDKLMWRYNFIPKEDILARIQGTPKEHKAKEESQPSVEQQEEPKQLPKEEEPSVNQTPEHEPAAPEKPRFESPVEPQTLVESTIVETTTETVTPSSSYKYEFTQEVADFLQKKELSITELIEESKNECTFIIAIVTPLGKTSYVTIAKSRKTINDSDIRAAKSIASEKHMPCYLLHKGKVTKAGQELIDEFQNLVKVESMQ